MTKNLKIIAPFYAILFLRSACAFAPNSSVEPFFCYSLARNNKRMLSSNNDDNVSGSFFNQVPDEPDSAKSSTPDSSKAGEDKIETDISELLRRRKSKPRSQTPSTIGGIPTSTVKGFGKPSTSTPKIINTTKAAKGTKKSFVEIGKRMNDINNPEYDDQGYTLYADEETGKKKRVFEALVEYPCEFTMKIVGANEGSFVTDILQVVADSCRVAMEKVTFSKRTNGKWISITVQAPVQSAEMLYNLYENIDLDPRVKFKF